MMFEGKSKLCRTFSSQLLKKGMKGGLNKTPTTQNEALFKGSSFTYIKPINMFSLYHKIKTSYQLYLLRSPTNPNCPQRTYTAKKGIFENCILLYQVASSLQLLFFLFSSLTNNIYQIMPQTVNIILTTCILTRKFCHIFSNTGQL